MLPAPIIDGKGTHTLMNERARTDDETEAVMNIPKGLGGIGNGSGVDTR